MSRTVRTRATFADEENSCVGQECELELSGKFQGKRVSMFGVLGGHVFKVKQQADRNIRENRGISICEILSVSHSLATNSQTLWCLKVRTITTCSDGNRKVVDMNWRHRVSQKLLSNCKTARCHNSLSHTNRYNPTKFYFACISST